MSERRHFCRFHFSGQVTLTDPAGQQHWHSQLSDLSLQGALVRTPPTWPAHPQDYYWLEYPLPGSDCVLRMRVAAVHQRGDQLGLRCLGMDLDSISHLKRLVQLNLGDDSLLQRELLELCGSREPDLSPGSPPSSS